MSESQVKAFMRDIFFVKDTSPHKYAVLYASKFYRVINPCLRDIEKHPHRKYICRFFVNFVKYFFEHGKKQSEIAQKVKVLYRGYPRLPSSLPFIDNAFISTTEDLSIAQRFGDKIISFKTSKLPTSVPYVIIDDSIAEYLFESEILFLPGKIDVCIKSYKATYTPKPNLNEMCEQYGGGPDIADLEIPKLDLRGKIVVWYRVVYGRTPEVIDFQNLPNTHKGVELLFRNKVFPRDTLLQDMRTYIPEYVDLRDLQNKTDTQCLQLQSYMVHMAIYDPTKNEIDTINYGVFDEVFPEIFDVSQASNVRKTIKKYFAK